MTEEKDCLNIFNNFSQIEIRYPDIKKWKIENYGYKERLKVLHEKSKLFNILKPKGKNLLLNINEDDEVLSWIDSLYLINETFKKVNTIIQEKAKLIQEYVIPYTNNNRVDFIIAIENKIAIIEFAYHIDDFIKKANQCLTYKEIIKQQVNENIKFYSYIFSYTNCVEQTKNCQSKLETQINDFKTFIETYLKPTNAFDELTKIKQIKQH